MLAKTDRRGAEALRRIGRIGRIVLPETRLGLVCPFASRGAGTLGTAEVEARVKKVKLAKYFALSWSYSSSNTKVIFAVRNCFCYSNKLLRNHGKERP